MRSCGSDAPDARSALGLPIVHLWEAVEWTEAFCASATAQWTLQFRTEYNCSNWTYRFGEHEFLSWQSVASSGDCASFAVFALDHPTLNLLRSLLGWAAESADVNPLICRVSMRNASTMRLVTLTPRIGRAIDVLLAI